MIFYILVFCDFTHLDFHIKELRIGRVSWVYHLHHWTRVSVVVSVALEIFIIVNTAHGKNLLAGTPHSPHLSSTQSQHTLGFCNIPLALVWLWS